MKTLSLLLALGLIAAGLSQNWPWERAQRRQRTNVTTGGLTNGGGRQMMNPRRVQQQREGRQRMNQPGGMGQGRTQQGGMGQAGPVQISMGQGRMGQGGMGQAGPVQVSMGQVGAQQRGGGQGGLMMGGVGQNGGMNQGELGQAGNSDGNETLYTHLLMIGGQGHCLKENVRSRCQKGPGPIYINHSK